MNIISDTVTVETVYGGTLVKAQGVFTVYSEQHVIYSLQNDLSINLEDEGNPMDLLFCCTTFVSIVSNNRNAVTFV